MTYSRKIRGAHIVYDDTGSGEVVVLVHGQPFNRSMWQPQVQALKNDWRFIVPDLRGYGESDIPAKTTLLDELALDILHLLEELGITRACFAGLSMGGQVVFDLYRLAPQVCRALILADTDAGAETETSYGNRLLLAKNLELYGMEKYTSENIHQYLCSQTLLQQPGVVAQLGHMMRSTNPYGAAAVQRGRAERRDHWQMLPAIACPSLVVVGKEDAFTPVAVAMKMHKAIPSSRIAVIENAGHLPNMEQPEIFNRHMRSFLQSLPR